MTDKLRDAAQQALDAYCRGWHKSFAAENPYDRISITDESRKHILAGLVEALTELAQQDAHMQPAGDADMAVYRGIAANYHKDKADLTQQDAQAVPQSMLNAAHGITGETK